MSAEPISTQRNAGPPPRGIFAIFAPAPPVPVTVTEPELVAARYRHWQLRVLIFSIRWQSSPAEPVSAELYAPQVAAPTPRPAPVVQPTPGDNPS